MGTGPSSRYDPMRPRRRPAGSPTPENDVPYAFTISHSRLSSASALDLREEINGHTGNDSETSSILRSIERFGGDATIRGYEVNPKPGRGTRLGPARVAWTVRALRV
jgi:hypothetical protein